MRQVSVAQSLIGGINTDFVVLIDGIYYDLCVGASCKINTGVPTNYPVYLRMCYVEGSGQLCKSCWDKTDSRA